MILTVTLNPLLERRFYFNSVVFNSENKNGNKMLKAGGKGINVSRQLNRLGVQNIALTFTGGTNGKLFKEILKNEEINFSDVQTKEEMRDAALIINEKKNELSTFFGKSINVSESEKNIFITRLEKMMANCEIVVFAGSSPCKETDSVFPFGIELANSLDKISICDTYGDHLKDCIDASPSVIHNNLDEIENSLNISLKDEKETLHFLDQLYLKGIKQAFITNGRKPFYVANFDFHYKISLPKIQAADSTGSGDAFATGIAYGWHNRLTFEEQLRFAAALGVSNAQSFETCNINKADAENLLEKIKIEPVGKKIKKINDSPDNK